MTGSLTQKLKSKAKFSRTFAKDSHCISQFLFTFISYSDSRMVKTRLQFWFMVARLVRVLVRVAVPSNK